MTDKPKCNFKKCLSCIAGNCCGNDFDKNFCEYRKLKKFHEEHQWHYLDEGHEDYPTDGIYLVAVIDSAGGISYIESKFVRHRLNMKIDDCGWFVNGHHIDGVVGWTGLLSF